MTRASVNACFAFGFAVASGFSATAGALAAVCSVFDCAAAGGGSLDARLRPLVVEGPALAVADNRDMLNNLEFETLRLLAAHPTTYQVPTSIESRLKDIGYAKEVLGGIVLTKDGLQRISEGK